MRALFEGVANQEEGPGWWEWVTLKDVPCPWLLPVSLASQSWDEQFGSSSTSAK